MKNRIYHIYNRGVDGRLIFIDGEDFDKFIKILSGYIGQFKITEDLIFKQERPYLSRKRQKMNLNGQVLLLAYCLMPDYFDLMVMQIEDGAVSKLMRRLGTAYVIYFNKKYQRRGTLFERTYQTDEVWGDERILHLSRWIHRKPAGNQVRRFGLVETVTGQRPEEYMYSSFQWYLRKDEIPDWISPGTVLEIFERGDSSRWKDYKDFVTDSRIKSEEVLGKIP